jgi:FkbM family methyltransferase
MSFLKPEYFYKPSNIFKRIFAKHSKELQKMRTCFGSEIWANSEEVIGRSIQIWGLYDLAVSEILYRLIQPNDTVLDIGANIGFTASICSHRAGSGGKVHMFEPNLRLHQQLENNISLFTFDNVILHKIGLSNEVGIAQLIMPSYFDGNNGVSYIGNTFRDNDEVIEININTLDSLFYSQENFSCKLAKIDVEGHELQVLLGADHLLNKKSITHILFEDQRGDNTVIDYLISKDYQIFQIEKNFFGLAFHPISKNITTPNWEARNLIATINEIELKRTFEEQGYKIL